MLKTTLALSCMMLEYVYRHCFSSFCLVDPQLTVCLYDSLDLWIVHNPLYIVYPEKRDPNFPVISCTKLGRFWWNLVHCFRNKFAAKLCKCFPPHLNDVSTLPCETWNTLLNCCNKFIQQTMYLILSLSPEIYIGDITKNILFFSSGHAV